MTLDLDQKNSAPSPEAAARFAVVPVDNPPMRGNELFPGCEDLRHPAFADLRRRYDLDAVVAGITGDLARILALRHWIAVRIRIEDHHPTEIARDYAVDILDAALAGGGFHCAHFSLVQDAILNAFGHVTRRLGAGDGRLERGRHHGVNEVWVDELGKWMLIDAKYDLHFEKNHIPLSALEVRDEILADGGKAVTRVYGPAREARIKEFPESLETYRWIAWELSTNRFSNPSCNVSSALVLYEDAYSRDHLWYRDGSPHWAYAARFFLTAPHRSWIEWTPNVLRSRVALDGHSASIRLASCTPNFATYRLQRDGGVWEDCQPRLQLTLPASGLDLRVRARNLAGVEGPVHRILIRPTTGSA